LFAEQAARAPDAPALAFAGETLTYAELDRRSNQLARALRARGVAPDTRVGVCVERSPEMVVALLGVLKSGGAFVPLDPAYPEDRLSWVLEDAAVPVLLTQERLLGRLPAHRAETICLDRDAAVLAAESDLPVEDATFAESLAYVIYTSGSTGRPKGVRVQHGSLLNTLLACREAFGLRAGDVIPSLASFAFDIWLFEALGPLVSGGAVRVIPTERITDMAALVAEIRDAALLHAVPALMRQVVRTVAASPEGPVAGVRRAFVGGDVVPADLWAEMRAAFPEAELWVLYGPTEGTILCTAHRVDDPARATRTLIGSPLANARVYVCDEPTRQVPVGVPGELLLGGRGVAEGYQGRPDLTAERFVPDPFGGEPGARLYRTGDRVRWLADGTLEFQGRTDQQVKVRGYRIEPGEIEATLLRHPAVDGAVVMVREDEPGDRRLVAYLVPPAGAAVPSAAELRAHIKESLPEYMVPGAFLALDGWPLTPSGKIDRNALPAPERGAGREGFVAPRNETEARLARAWEEVLRVPSVGVHDNFFELGGDSILSIQVVARAHRAGVQLKPRHFFEHPTIAELAPLAGSAAAVEAEQGIVTGEVPLTPVQAWFFDQDVPERAHWNMPVLLAPREALERGALAGAVRAVLEHHDALRLRYTRGADGHWTQHNAAADAEAPLEWIDLSGASPEERAAAVERRAGELQRSLDLTSGPLVRTAYFHFGEEPGRLLFMAHHLVVDGASWRTLVEDLETAYGQLRRGEAAALPPKTTSFREWALKLEGHARSGALDAELGFWADEARAGVPALPVDGAGPNTTESETTLGVELDEAETRALLQEVTAAYHAQINDVLLAALARAFARWTGESRLLVEMEGHGREEEVVEGVDLSRTVGWLTAMYPVLLDLRGAEDGGAALRAVKEQLRALPGRGIGYGLLRWLGSGAARERLRALPRAQVAFNYLGQLGATFSSESFWDVAREPVGRTRAPGGERSVLLEVNVLVSGDGVLRARIAYSPEVHREDTVRRLADAFAEELRALAAGAGSVDAGGYTPGDFPLAGLDQAGVDALLGSERGVEDVYPLTPMQEGMLFHTLVAPEGGAYVGQFSYDLVGELDEEAFERAWQGVVRRHAVLRTGFAWDDGIERPFQVVRRGAELRVRREDWRGLSGADQDARMEAFLDADRAEGFDPARPPLMRVGLFRLADERRRLVWTHHHILLDGWSIPLVFRDLVALYDAYAGGREAALVPNHAYRDYIAWLLRQDLAAAEGFWREALAGFTAPTPLGLERSGGAGRERGFDRATFALSPESSAAVQALARSNGLTLNTLVQGAWALVLSRYSGETDVVFGSTVSGRPPEVEGVEGMVGLFINTLPVRVRVDAAEPVLPWLRALQGFQAQVRELEYSPLAQVQRWSEVQGAPLFESILVFENFPVEDAVREMPQREFEVETVEGREQTDYPLTI
ncbi:MAG TPA: amino acid adenylation domain-containing protein, partial [Longimicrobiaceae bacterium]